MKKKHIEQNNVIMFDTKLHVHFVP